MKKNLLIALDESVNSALSLEYIAELFAGDKEVEFSLLHCVSESAGILPEPEDARKSLMPQRPLSKGHQRCTILMHKAQQKLISLGIDESRITTNCQQATIVTSTIQHIAESQLVDSIVISRRGVGMVGELLLGSVSASLFDSCRSVPLWIIDGPIQSKRILVPVDGTPSSLMAIDHLAHIFSRRSDVTFFLFHARGFLSPPPTCRPEDFYDKWGKDWCDTHLSGNGCMYTGPTELLTDAGIPKESIITLPEPTAIEESTAIIRNAKKNGCGTIVIGRRSREKAKGIFGGVSKRTILQAEDLALWVVG